MDKDSSVLAIVGNEVDPAPYHQVAQLLGYNQANIVVGTAGDGADFIRSNGYSPKFLILDIGNNGQEVLPELDNLAEQCEMGTKVAVVGATNDIAFYRALIARGVSEYFTYPANAQAIRGTFLPTGAGGDKKSGHILSFMGASAGDGSSTMALNTAYALYKKGKSVVLVDMDYQFGIIAKSLDVASPYGIKDIFEHPDRGVDSTLIQRMVVSYDGKFDLVAAPNTLHFMPTVSPDMIRDMLAALQSRYDYVVLDVPHVWDRWVATALTASDHVVVVAQLWLKSVVHCSRLLNTWRPQGIEGGDVSVVINRSGAKFKEALNPRDFERAAGHKIDFFISNDIKTVVRAENNGSSIFELGNSPLANQIQQFVDEVTSKFDRKRSSKQSSTAEQSAGEV